MSLDRSSVIVWAVSVVLAIFVVWRGFAKVLGHDASGAPVRKIHPAKVGVGVFSALLGLTFAALYTLAQRLEAAARLKAAEQFGDVDPASIPAQNLPFSLRDEIVRYSSLGVGVLFLCFVLAAAMPLALDVLERLDFGTFVASRHVRATKSGFLTVISVLSILGVGVSSCALCSVTSIMGGFGHDLKTKILGNNAHLVIDTKKPGGFAEWETALDGVRAALGDKGTATPVVSGDAMSSSATNTAGVLVKGVDPDTIGDVIDLRKNLELGRFHYLHDKEALANLPVGEIICKAVDGSPRRKAPEITLDDLEDVNVDPKLREFRRPKTALRPGVILGRELAKSLHVCVGDEITLLSPMGDLGPMGVMPRTRKYRVAGIFYSAMYEYDASHAYVTLDEAQRFFGMEEKISQIDVRVKDPENVEKISPTVTAILPGLYDPARRPDGAPKGPELRLRDWKEMNKNLFSALKLERIATFLILSIAIAVASFCIICTLLLMVTEKTRQIAIMKALGASNWAIGRIFVLEGVIIGAIGTLFGVGIALAVTTGLKWFGTRLPPEVYYIDRLPVNVDLADYGLVAISAMVICTLSTIYPSIAAASVAPVDGLRHE
jgi:lipoprotein-releasing system permease protein